MAAPASEILGDGPDRIRAVITYAGNPVLSTPQRGQLDKALGSLDFYAAVDMYTTEVLPLPLCSLAAHPGRGI